MPNQKTQVFVSICYVFERLATLESRCFSTTFPILFQLLSRGGVQGTTFPYFDHVGLHFWTPSILITFCHHFQGLKKEKLFFLSRNLVSNSFRPGGVRGELEHGGKTAIWQHNSNLPMCLCTFGYTAAL